MTSRINHVSVNARDLEASVAFYAELLGAERLPAPNFGFPIAWLGLERTQLHLFQADLVPPAVHHCGVSVHGLTPAYRVPERRDCFEREAFANHIVELPGDIVQLYLRDPSGNLVELDQHGVERLPDDIRAQVRRLADVQPQSEENLSARLYVR